MNKIPMLLIVDDDPKWLDTIQDVLGDKFLYKTALNGEEAVELFNSDEFTVVIIDKSLPDIDGLDVLRSMSKVNPNLRAIILTAYASIESAIESFKIGAIDYISKGDKDWGEKLKSTISEIILYEGTIDAKSVAYFFIDLAKNNNQPINSIKLQRLVYFTHGWHLAIEKKPLLNELVEASPYGPAIPSIYSEFRKFGEKPIVIDSDTNEVDEYLTYFKKLDQASISLLKKVWDIYGEFDYYQLSKMAIGEGTPWRKTWRPEVPVNKPIENEIIEVYFSKLVKSKGIKQKKIDSIVLPEIKSSGGDSTEELQLTRNEEKDLEREAKKLNLCDKREDLAGKKFDRRERKKYGNRIFYMIVSWLSLIFIVLFLQGFGSDGDWFNISDSVLMTLIGGTTVNILGIFIIVTNYLFRKPIKLDQRQLFLPLDDN